MYLQHILDFNKVPWFEKGSGGPQQQKNQTDLTVPPEEMGLCEDWSSTKAGPPVEIGFSTGCHEQRNQTHSTVLPDEEMRSCEEDWISTKAGPPAEMGFSTGCHEQRNQTH